MAAGRRTATIVLTSSHAALSLIAGLLFFFFVLPRWPELNGATGHTFGTGMRIVGGLLVAAAGAPVLISWRRTRRPEFATPRLALTLRAASFTGHFLAGVLIVRDSDRRDLAGPRPLRYLGVRGVRRRRGNRDTGLRGLSPGLCGRASRAGTQAAPGQEEAHQGHHRKRR